ncbi:MAG: wax ester/triacylglycerol synthase family O-acyltransferase [Mycobacteriaceae bacterium]
MGDSLDAVGLPTELSAFDFMMHKGEGDARTRSGILGLEIFDTAPDWERYRARYEHASRKVLRLRQKVVVSPLPTAAPRWVVDPDFNLDFHVRRVRVPEPGTLRQVLDLAESILQGPLDVSRPLWTTTLVEGLAGGRAAALLHMSHVVTDGVGGVEMFTQLYDFERDAPAKPELPMPVPQDLSENELMLEGLARLPGAVMGGVRGALLGSLRVVGRTAIHPVSTVTDVADFVRSASRGVQQGPPPSPVLAGRSLSTRTELLEITLSDLRAAAKAGGGSINDAFLGGLCGALRRYHDALGVPIASLPMVIPMSIRAESDAAGGNRFTGVNLTAPVDVVDPVERMRRIHAQVIQRRDEPARDMFEFISPVLNLVPMPVLKLMMGSFIGADVQASNVPVDPRHRYMVGAKVLRQFSLGPLPGVAVMVILLSYGGVCNIAVRYDRAAITDEALFARCLVEGFDEILALAGKPTGHAVLVSSDVGPVVSSSGSGAGS